MPPSSFAALSPLRNFTSKPIAAYSEVPVLPTADAHEGRSLEVSMMHVFARGSLHSSLNVLNVGEQHTGKYAGNAPIVNLSFTTGINNVEVSPHDAEIVSVGGNDGSIAVTC